MRRRWFLYPLLVVALLASSVAPAASITHGEPDSGEYPWVGAILIGPFEGEYFQFCSGSWTRLGEVPFFLTAGHCIFFLDVFGISNENRWVSFQPDLDLNDDGSLTEDEVGASLIQFQDAAYQPGFKAQAASASVIEDAAWVRLDLSNPNLPESMGTLAGVGAMDDVKAARTKPAVTTVGYGISEWLRPGFLPTDERRVAEGELKQVLRSQLALSQVYSNGKGDPAKKNEGSCYGDSGGPAIYDEEIVGVTSWGDARCVSTGFYYRVDTQAVQNWLAADLN